ncbi:MAG: hypothetical protein P8M68_06060 [Aquiluna sp.]|nr:hypothetical protein [Aquiluna sp.]
MGNSVGLGGVTLVIAAIVWLLIFVPGYARRSQIKETSKLVASSRRAEKKLLPQTNDEKLRRLMATQRTFSIVFALTGLAAIASAAAAMAQNSWWFVFAIASLVSVASLLIQRAAGKQAATTAGKIFQGRQHVRTRAAKNQATSAKSREWTPNPMPAPISQNFAGELIVPSAEVISITTPRPALAKQEIDKILARRRAI